MAVRSAVLLAMLISSTIAFAAPPIGARGVTTDQCLARGLCAYVSPHGRVTCGKCPGQVRAIRFSRGTTAVCNDGSFAREAASARMCRGRAGGIAARVKP